MDRQLDLLQGAASGQTGGPELIRRQGLALRYGPGWIADHQDLMATLLREIPWKQESITLYGRTHPIPRRTCWMGDPGCSYTYSGVRNRIEAWTPTAERLRRRAEEAAGHPFNSLLLNHYRDGNDKLDWHADDEPELDPQRSIASISLGSRRSFRLRHRDPSLRDSAPLCFELGEGDLLVMDPPTQEHWLHQVPRRLRLTTPRINLTFRVIRPEAVDHV